MTIIPMEAYDGFADVIAAKQPSSETAACLPTATLVHADASSLHRKLAKPTVNQERQLTEAGR
jgi:hypothetical protein